MKEILEGIATDLSKILEVEGYDELFLFEANRCCTSDWEEYCRLDLGRRRKLFVYRDSYLIFIKGREVKFEHLEFPERYYFDEDEKGLHKPAINLVELLRSEKINCRSVQLSHWENKARSYRAFVSENGMAIQHSYWADSTFYDIEFKFFTKGQLILENYDIRNILGSGLIGKDIFYHARKLIIKALEKPHKVTGKDLVQLAKSVGLEDNIPYLHFIY